MLQQPLQVILSWKLFIRTTLAQFIHTLSAEWANDKHRCTKFMCLMFTTWQGGKAGKGNFHLAKPGLIAQLCNQQDKESVRVRTLSDANGALNCESVMLDQIWVRYLPSFRVFRTAMMLVSAFICSYASSSALLLSWCPPNSTFFS